jgi:hypothetical protein
MMLLTRPEVTFNGKFVVLSGMETPKNKTGLLPAVEGSGTIVGHTIRYRRPETPYSLSKMTTSNREGALMQIQRLKSLGYTVVEVVPPLASDAPSII